MVKMVKFFIAHAKSKKGIRKKIHLNFFSPTVLLPIKCVVRWGMVNHSYTWKKRGNKKKGGAKIRRKKTNKREESVQVGMKQFIPHLFKIFILSRKKNCFVFLLALPSLGDLVAFFISSGEKYRGVLYAKAMVSFFKYICINEKVLDSCKIQFYASLTY